MKQYGAGIKTDVLTNEMELGFQKYTIKYTVT